MDKSHLKFEGISNPQIINDQLDLHSTNPLAYIQHAYETVPEADLPHVRTTPPATESLSLVEYADSGQCTTAIAPPSIGLIERGDALDDFNQRIGLFSHYDIIGFSVTTQTASEHNFARYLCAMAQAHFHVSDKVLSPMTLAVQEAAINALAHGNLELRSVFQETGDDLNLYYELIRARSRIDTYKNRRLDLFAWETGDSVFMAITDQGGGYESAAPSGPSPHLHSPIIERRKSGRGLDIIRQFSQDYWLSAGGRSIVLRFVK